MQEVEQQQNLPQEKKKQKKPKQSFALKPEHFQNKNGLKKLYQLTNEVKWDDPLPIQTAMNMVIVSLKTWHYQMMPKYSYDYFLQRCQALGNHKITSGYMNKVRRIHKGIESWGQQEINEQQKKSNQNIEPQMQQFSYKINMLKQMGSIKENVEKQDQIDDEDLKMFEQMSRKKKQKQIKEQKKQQVDEGVNLQIMDQNFMSDDGYYDD